MAKHLIGISLGILAVLCFSLTYAFYKACLPFLPNTLVIFFQSLISWTLIAPFILKRNGVKELATHRLGMIILRTIFGLLSVYCASRALMSAKLSEVILLNNTAPLFVPFISYFWLKEKINHRLWPSLIIGFIGILVIIRPGFIELNSSLIFALFSGIFGGLLLVAAHQIAHEPFFRLLFYYFLIFWVVLAPFLFISWSLPPLKIWIYLALAGIAMILGQISFTAAFRYAYSQEVAPFIYTGVIFSGLIDWAVWGETPGMLSIIGMGIVCVGGVLTILLNKK